MQISYSFEVTCILLAFCTLQACDQIAPSSDESATKINGEGLAELNEFQRKNILHIRTADPSSFSNKVGSECLGFLLQESDATINSTATLVTALHCIAQKDDASGEIRYLDRLWLSESGEAEYVAVTPILSCGNEKHFAGDSTKSLSSLDLAFVRILWPRPFAGIQLAAKPAEQNQLEIYGQTYRENRHDIVMGQMDWKLDAPIQVYDRIIRNFSSGTNYEPGDSGGPLTYGNGRSAIGVAIARNGCGTQSNYMVDLFSAPSQALWSIFRSTAPLPNSSSQNLCPQEALNAFDKEYTFCADQEEIGLGTIDYRPSVKESIPGFLVAGTCHVSVTTWEGRYFLVAAKHCAEAARSFEAACLQDGIRCNPGSQDVTVPEGSDLAILEIASTSRALPAAFIRDSVSNISMYSCPKTMNDCKQWPVADANIIAKKAFAKKSLDSTQPLLNHNFITEPSDSGAPIYEIDDDAQPIGLICLQSNGREENTCSNLSYWLDQL